MHNEIKCVLSVSDFQALSWNWSFTQGASSSFHPFKRLVAGARPLLAGNPSISSIVCCPTLLFGGTICCCWKTFLEYVSLSLVLTRGDRPPSIFRQRCMQSIWYSRTAKSGEFLMELSNHQMIFFIGYIVYQGGRTWQAFGGGKNGHETFRQTRIYNFRDKCVVFARNLKFSNLTQ